MKDRFKILLLFLSMLLLCVMGCSSGAEDGGSGSDDDTTTQSVSSISVSVSSSSVKSDGSDSITVAAAVLDSSNAAIQDATVRFSTTSGMLSASSATTDDSGTAEITFQAGAIDKSNRTATITVTSGGRTATVPIQITGTSVSVTQGSTTLNSSDATDTLEIYVTDAGGSGIYNADVTIAVDSSSTGSVSLSSTSGTTGVDGSLDVTVTAETSGSAILNVSAAGATTSCTYTVSTTSGSLLQITAPTANPATLEIGQTMAVTVSDPDNGTVVLSTTLGTLDGSSAVSLDASSGSASATLETTMSGTATIQAYNMAAPRVTDTVSVVMYAPAEDASQLALQASSTVIGLSSTDVSNSITLTARVTDELGNPVGDAAVVYSMANTPGGGEKLAPSVAISDEYGYAETTLTSGSLSTSGSGMIITASLLTDSGVSTTITDSINIIIGGTSGSVVVGESTTILSVSDDTAYELPVSVLVSDSNGNPVPGAIVTINLWPKYYWIGDCVYGLFGDDDSDAGDGSACTGYLNEDDYWGQSSDYYRNQVLDDGEDTNTDCGNNNGQLTPPNSSAGNMPSTVEVDENGVGTIDWTYLKTYAGFVTAEIKVSTEVLGSETTTTVLRRLRPSQDDVDDEVLSGVTPFDAPASYTP